MEKIRVNSSEVLSILKENRKKHKKEFSEAIKAYRVKCADLLTKELQKIVSGEQFSVNFGSTLKPESHVKEYDLAIQMLEMSVDDVIELEQYEFNQLINDDWQWKQNFRMSYHSNSAYFGTTTVTTTSTNGSSGTQGCCGSEGSSDRIIDINFSENEIFDEN